MDLHVKDVIEDCTSGSDAGRLKFPQVVMKLKDAGVEQYHADLRRGEKTYYMPDGKTYVVACAALDSAPAEHFSANGIETAIKAIQAGAIGYKAFCEQIAASGCVGYFVSIAGQRAVYFGRTSEAHVEPFPQT